MHGQEQDLCPKLPGEDEPVCAWGGRLELALAASGGRFSQTWEVYAEGPIPLPGGEAHWPLDVKVDGRQAVAAAGDDGTPRVRVA
ncbi:MAG TPA: hypothetical protein VIF57_14430, partial [Polyangia bacterium]